MRKAKKTKVPQRRSALDRIAAKLRTALCRETTNIIEIGNLLIESREHLDHGEWLPWLKKNFDLSLRSAQRYIASAEYVAGKSDTVAHFANLAPTVLYDLAYGNYSDRAEAAILAAAHERRIDQDAVDAICEALALPDDDDADDQEGSSSDDDVSSEEDPESAAILDGPPPAVPPPAPIPPPTNFALRDFDEAISKLKTLMTKSLAQFDGTVYSGDDLQSIIDFINAVIRAVTKAKATAANGSTEAPR